MVRADLYKSRTTSSGKIIPPFLLKEGEKKYGPDNPPPFTSGGGSRSRQSEVNQEEIARRQAELQAQEEARRQAEQERKKLEEQRRQEEIRRKQEETYGKKFVLRQKERERQQEFIKQQAVARGVDISTEVRKRGFVKKLRKEQTERKVKVKEIPQQVIKQESTKSKREITLGDVDFLRTFAGGQSYTEGGTKYYRLDESEEFKEVSGVTLPEYIDVKYQRFIEPIGQKISKKVGLSGEKKYSFSISDTLKFAFFNPFLRTTGEIYSSLPKQTKVKFQGVEQGTSPTEIRTQIKFRNEAGEVGGAVGLTKIQSSGQIQKTKSLVAGIKSKPYYDLFRRKMVYKNQETFFGITRGLSAEQTATLKTTSKRFRVEKQVKGIFQSEIGALKKGGIGSRVSGQYEKFASGSFSISKGQAKQVFGVAKTTTGTETVSAGRIIKLPPELRPLLKKGPKTTPALTPALKTIQSDVSGVITKAVGTTTSKPAIPTVIKSASTTVTPTLSKTKVQLTQIPKQEVTTQPISRTGQPIFRTGTKTKSDLNLAFSSREQTKQKSGLKTKTISRQAPAFKESSLFRQKENQLSKQATSSRLALRTKTKTQSKFATIPTSISISPSTRGFKPLGLGKKSKIEPKTVTYTVSIRRFGKFKPIGRVRSQRKAFEIGRKRVSQSLGASFKIEGAGTKFKTPKGFYSKTEKGGRLFIEKPKYRLSTKSELGEIQTFKRRSPKKKARKRGKKKI